MGQINYFKVGQMGEFAWSVSKGEDLIHPDDLQKIIQLFPSGKLFEIVGIGDHGYIRISHGSTVVRIIPKTFRLVDAYVYKTNQPVFIRSRGTHAIVGEIFWHSSRNEPFYLLFIEGKLHKRRYYNSELSLEHPHVER